MSENIGEITAIEFMPSWNVLEMRPLVSEVTGAEGKQLIAKSGWLLALLQNTVSTLEGTRRTLMRILPSSNLKTIKCHIQVSCLDIQVLCASNQQAICLYNVALPYAVEYVDSRHLCNCKVCPPWPKYCVEQNGECRLPVVIQDIFPQKT